MFKSTCLFHLIALQVKLLIKLSKLLPHSHIFRNLTLRKIHVSKTTKILEDKQLMKKYDIFHKRLLA